MLSFSIKHSLSAIRFLAEIYKNLLVLQLKKIKPDFMPFFFIFFTNERGCTPLFEKRYEKTNQIVSNSHKSL